MVKHPTSNLEFPVLPFFVLATAFVLLIFTLSPYYQAGQVPPPPPRRGPEPIEWDEGGPTPTTAFVCPEGEYLDCMPGPGPTKFQCQSEYLNWASKTCPDFKGAAY